MVANGIGIQNMKVVVNNSATHLTCQYALQRLDGLVAVTNKYPVAHGGYADIYPGLLAERAVAIKVFRDAHLKADTPEAQQKYSKRLNKEYHIWALLNHPNVLPLFGLVDDPSIPSTGIVAPFCSLGDLRGFFANQASATANRLAIVTGIASGLAYVHEENVVHGDLTMNNVLVEVVNGHFTPRISDFGRSRVLERVGYTTAIGGAVHRHLPPEILAAEDKDRSTKAFTQPVDVWCFGMLMLETLTGKIPFWYMNELQAAMVVGYGNERPKRDRYPAFPQDNGCWKIMRRCWHGEPSHREKMPRLLQSLNALEPDL